MTPPPELLNLIDRFDHHVDDYRAGSINETEVRVMFIDPLFKLLGWDIDNTKGYADAYKDVIHEDAIKIGGVTKAPDYCFRVGGTRKFFLEAKKPSINLKQGREAIAAAYQVRRYAWTAKLHLSVLTDFEEMAIYDCRVRPHKLDKPAVARIKYYTYREFAEHWDEISGVFSRDAVLKGDFDRFVESKKVKKGSQEVDDAFLSEIETWRELLAKNIALRNETLTTRELNFAVQRTIDRLIFLRICEDRAIEPYGQLQGLLNGANIYKRLVEIFYRADQKYNSGLFHFGREKARPTTPDELTTQLSIDDKELKKILSRLYYPDSPYEFSVLPAEILGQVYEQFLGKQIRLTASHRAVVEEKPEVKKAGGVYYTPAYIVDYIVKNTVGKLVEGKKPKDVAKLRVLDPACGSGSFLIQAYQFLLDWHRDYYRDHGNQTEKKLIYEAMGGEWRLVTEERKRILLNNIYGVDIDSQAVEVTKLSLLLKVLEGETEQTLSKQLELLRKRVLPDLASNIKCGNSLIGPDFYDQQELDLSQDEIERINVFSWEDEFSEIMQGGGFDAVIGNPPYVRSINLKGADPKQWAAYKLFYKTAADREWDIYYLFAEKGLKLLNSSGKLGYILPNKFFTSLAGENLRKIISNANSIEQIVNFNAFQVFKSVTTYTCILILSRASHNKAVLYNYTGDINASYSEFKMPFASESTWYESVQKIDEFSQKEWHLSSASIDIFGKLSGLHKLSDYTVVFSGTGTRADRIFLLKMKNQGKGKLSFYSEYLKSEVQLESTFIKSAVRGREIKRYHANVNNSFLVVPYETDSGKVTLISAKNLKNQAPHTYNYLQLCREGLEKREKGKYKGENFYCYGRPQNMDKLDNGQKIIFPDVSERGNFYLDKSGIWLIDTAYAIILKEHCPFTLEFFTGLLNSKLLTYFLKLKGTPLRGGYFRMKTSYLNPFPIPEVNASNKKYKSMITLVVKMLALHESLSIAKTDHEKTLLQRQIDATDRQIDRLVYELYGLTEEEIRIVEESVK